MAPSRIPAASPSASIGWRWRCSRSTGWSSKSGRTPCVRGWRSRIRCGFVNVLHRTKAEGIRGENRAAITKTWTYFDGAWHAGNVPIMGPRTHAAWLGSMVFDGARAFEGVTPDLDLHCARVNDSAARFHLKPLIDRAAWMALTVEGRKRFDADADLYIRPMYWADNGSAGGIRHDPESTRWCLCIYEAALPKPTGSSITLSPYRRPTPDSAPTDAKAGCLYPNNARAIFEAQARRFDNCLMCDALGNVAEL